MGGGARKRERSKAWAGKKQEKEAKLKAMERESAGFGAQPSAIVTVTFSALELRWSLHAWA